MKEAFGQSVMLCLIAGAVREVALGSQEVPSRVGCQDVFWGNELVLFSFVMMGGEESSSLIELERRSS